MRDNTNGELKMSNFYDESYAVEVTDAVKSGFYDEFTGTIDYCGTCAQVENATFKLTKGGDIIFYNGTWKYGNWARGTFKGGTWISGVFVGGIWEGGLFKNGTIHGGFFLNGKIQNAIDKDGNKITSKAKITSATKKALKVVEKVIAKKRKDALKKDMSEFKTRVKEWADKNFTIEDVLEFFNFIYGGKVAVKSHTPEANRLLKEFQELYPNLRWEEIKTKYVDSTYMWCGHHLTTYKVAIPNMNLFDEKGDEFARYYGDGRITCTSCCWRTPSTSGNKEAWDYLFDCYFKGNIPSQFNYLKEAMDSMI